MNTLIHQTFFKITVLLLTLCTIIPSFGMFTCPYTQKKKRNLYIVNQQNPKKLSAAFFKQNFFRRLNNVSTPLLEAPPLNLPILPEDVQLKIFAAAQPQTKNYWIMTSKHWKELNLKTIPNIYTLYQNHGPICAVQKDMTFLLLNAVWQDKIELVENILHNTKQRDFFYIFPRHVFWNENDLSHRYFNVHDIIRLKKCCATASSDDDALVKAVAMQSLMKKYGINNKLSYIENVVPHDLIMACYSGNCSLVKHTIDFIKHYQLFCDAKLALIHALSIAIDREHKDIIIMLCDFIEQNKEFKVPIICFFDLAVNLQKKEIFELLISRNVKLLNKIYTPDDLIPSPMSSRTYYDLIKDRANNLKLDEYVALVAQYGGKARSKLIPLGFSKHSYLDAVEMHAENYSHLTFDQYLNEIVAKYGGFWIVEIIQEDKKKSDL